MSEAEAYEQLYNLLSDRLESCVLVGYGFDGRRIQVNHWSTSKDRDALETLLKAACSSFELPQPVEIVEACDEDSDEEGLSAI